MKNRLKQGFTLIELLVVITIIAILASLSMAAIGKMQEKGQITKAINNCRNIVMAVKLYASDENGNYPDQYGTEDAASANEAFRNLFKAGALEDEKIFGCGASKFNPDGNIGSAPEYEQAVASGENHWSMTALLNNSSPGGIPLIFENAASEGSDPSWNADAAGRPVKGRTWSGGKVIIGTNDGSVELMKCDSTKGSGVKLKPLGDDGKNLFTMYAGEEEDSMKILPVEDGDSG